MTNETLENLIKIFFSVGVISTLLGIICEILAIYYDIKGE